MEFAGFADVEYTLRECFEFLLPPNSQLYYFS